MVRPPEDIHRRGGIPISTATATIVTTAIIITTVTIIATTAITATKRSGPRRWEAAGSHCVREGTRLIARIVFDIDIYKGLLETVPATGSRRKSRDHLRPRSGRILPRCDIGSSSTRL